MDVTTPNCFFRQWVVQQASKMQKVILNKCYGGFTFSDEFVAELFRRYPGDRSLWGEPYAHDYDDHRLEMAPLCEGYSKHPRCLLVLEEATGKWYDLPTEGWTLAKVRLRCDPRVVALFEEWKKAGREVNGMYCSRLALETVPEHWEWYVSKYDGLETLKTEFPWKPVLSDLLKGTQEHPITRKLLAEKLTLEEYLNQVQPAGLSLN